MITTAYIAKMADYNRWMNEGIYAAARTLTDDQRREDLGFLRLDPRDAQSFAVGRPDLDEPVCRNAGTGLAGQGGRRADSIVICISARLPYDGAKVFHQA